MKRIGFSRTGFPHNIMELRYRAKAKPLTKYPYPETNSLTNTRAVTRTNYDSLKCGLSASKFSLLFNEAENYFFS